MIKAALFDLDGVVFDTEPQYSIFWGGESRRYFPEIPGLENKIKGQTLVQIFDGWFSGVKDEQPKIVERLDEFESRMDFIYVSGFEGFITGLRKKGIKTAIVTSSNLPKMRSLYEKHPEVKDLFDAILTSEDFEYSKPHPDCYLKAAARFGVDIKDCVVFEDSFNGLKSGKASGAFVVGLATTNKPEDIAPLSDVVIDDFQNVTLETLGC